MDIDIASVHEAGHAVIFWLTGNNIAYMRMKIVNGDARDPAVGCPDPGRYPDLSTIRKRLVMIFSGNAATRQRWPDSENDYGDWKAAVLASVSYLGGTIDWPMGKGPQLNSDQRAFVDDARNKASEMVADPLLRHAIDTIALSFASTPPDAEGTVSLEVDQVIRMCVELIGEDFRRKNPWKNWLDGR